MKICISADHGGFELKKIIIEHIKSLGLNVDDLNDTEYDPEDDYPDTTKLVAKSISKNGGRSSYRGLLKVNPKAHGCRSKVVCDALMLDADSRSDTYPTMEVSNSSADLEHEASVSKISGDQLFYLMSRGFNEEEAMGLIVNGFFEPFTRELPMEYAVELNKLLELEMEGAIG